MRLHWHWGTKIALVYAVFAGSTLGFVTYAMRQQVDLVSPEYYADSLSYDARQAAASRVLELGSAFRFEAGDNGRSLAVTWPASARPTSGRLHLYRASGSALDRTLGIDPETIDPAGRLLIPLSEVETGSWLAQLEWTARNEIYFAELRVVVR
jgi:hypothetical protein